MFLMGGWTLGVAHGIPVRLHWSMPLLALILFPDLGWLVLPLLGVLMAAVFLHELGHAVVAQDLGFRVDQILLTPLGGVALIRAQEFNPADEMRIAVAGPLVSLVLALVGIAAGWTFEAFRWHDAADYAWMGLAVPNASLFLFNLLPAFPMDGGRMLRAVLTPRKGRMEATRLAAGLGRGLALVFGAAALLVLHNLRLTALAVFIHVLAGAEWRALQRRRALAGLFPGADPSPGDLSGDDWVVSPPPYAIPAQRGLWMEIGEAARVLRDRLVAGRRGRGRP